MKKLIVFISFILFALFTNSCDNGCSGNYGYPAADYVLEYAIHYPDGTKIFTYEFRSHNSNTAPQAFVAGRQSFRLGEEIRLNAGLHSYVIVSSTCPLEIISLKKITVDE